eukprot:PhM_4_TR14076/c2_g1_i1/m.60823
MPFETYSVLAAPYPKTLRGSVSPSSVCRQVAVAINKLLQVNVGHAEVSDNAEGIRIYLPNKEMCQRVLSAKTVDVLNTTMRLTPLPTKLLKRVASPFLAMYNLHVDIQQMYRSYLLYAWLPNVSEHSVDVHINDVTGVTVSVSFPPHADSDVKQLAAKFSTATIFGASINAMIVRPKATSSSADSNNNKNKPVKAHIELRRQCSPQDLNDALALKGVRDFSVTSKGNTRHHTVLFANGAVDFLYCRGRLSHDHADTHFFRKIDLAEGCELDLATETPSCVGSDPNVHNVKLFLSGFETDLRVIYDHIVHTFFSCGGKKKVSIHNFSLVHRAMVIEFPSALDAAVAHTWSRTKMFGSYWEACLVPVVRAPRLPPAAVADDADDVKETAAVDEGEDDDENKDQQEDDNEKVETKPRDSATSAASSRRSSNSNKKSKEASPYFHTLRVVCSQPVPPAALDEFLRRQCGNNWSGGLVSVHRLNNIKQSKKDKDDEYQLLFLMHTSKDVATCLSLNNNNVDVSKAEGADDEFVVNGATVKLYVTSMNVKAADARQHKTPPRGKRLREDMEKE